MSDFLLVSVLGTILTYCCSYIDHTMLAQVYLADQLPEALKQHHGPKKGLPKEALEEVKRKCKHNKGEGGLCLSCSAAFSVLTEVLAKCLGAGPGPSSKRR